MKQASKGIHGTGNQDNIRVAVRLRPPLEYECTQGNTFQKIHMDNESRIVK